MSTAPAASGLDYLDLSYRPDLRVLTVRWLRSVSFPELQAGFRQALDMALACQAAYWLVDVRRRTEIDAIPSTWVAQHLLPEAAAGLAPATLYVAYLLSPVRAEQIVTNPALQAATAQAQAPTQPYRLETFIDEGPAVQWLLSKRQ
ncbi:hypothetical protein [Hymenobacter koreensis]|uniref:STAS/SEC14 domain-containing protein n=1 Tax=Hymenobacter koreensis TaxID=1084523 RepID=A0ABP8IUB2_9BACT